MLSLVLFIIILGTIVLIHELGHFLFAKLFGVYVYEYSIGMGKKFWSKKPENSETEYCLRLIPIGGFVRLAGEEGDDGTEGDVPEDQKLYKKTFLQRFLIFFMGPGFNLVLAFVALFVSCLFWGGSLTTMELDNITNKYPAYEAGLRNGDVLIAVDGEKMSTWTQARLKIATTEPGSSITFKVQDTSGKIKNVKVTPKKENVDGEISYIYGVGCKVEKYSGITGAPQYAFMETRETLLSMFDTLKYLFTGKIGIDSLSGPVGVYEVVDEQAKSGASDLFYLLAYLSINVGVINLIPFPAFDGGHILFLIIEKIRRKPVSANVEATITGIGFLCLMLLMFYVTCHDVLNLIH